MTTAFEHRHKNKSCSACPNDQHHLTHLTLYISYMYATFEDRHENKSCSAHPKEAFKLFLISFDVRPRGSSQNVNRMSESQKNHEQSSWSPVSQYIKLIYKLHLTQEF